MAPRPQGAGRTQPLSVAASRTERPGTPGRLPGAPLTARQAAPRSFSRVSRGPRITFLEAPRQPLRAEAASYSRAPSRRQPWASVALPCGGQLQSWLARADVWTPDGGKHGSVNWPTAGAAEPKAQRRNSTACGLSCFPCSGLWWPGESPALRAVKGWGRSRSHGPLCLLPLTAESREREGGEERGREVGVSEPDH